MATHDEQNTVSRAGYATLASVLVVWSAVMMHATLERDLWAPDEPRYAEVAREMAVSGDWVLPHLNASVYPNKPPLLFWLIAASARASGGFGNVSVRVPSFLAGLALVGITWLMGRKLYDGLSGVVSACVLLTTYALLWFLPRVNMDTLFACGVSGAIFCSYLALTSAAPRRGTVWLAYALVGLATMTKGPAAPVMVLVAVAAVVGYRGQWKESRKLLSPVGLLLLAAICGIWLALAAHRGGHEYLRAMFVDQNLGKTVRSHSHPRPLYYYLYNLPIAFAPWSVFLPACIARAWREVRSDRQSHRAFLFVVSAALVILMSLSSGKRLNYLMSVLPFLSVLLGQQLAEVWSGRAFAPSERATCWSMAGLLGAGAIGAGIAVVVAEEELVSHAVPVAAIIGLAVVVSVIGLRTRRPRAVLSALAALMLFTTAYANVAFFPDLNARKSVRPLAEHLQREDALDPDARFATYRFSRPGGLNFYSGLSFDALRTVDEAIRFFKGGKRCFCVVDSKVLYELETALPSQFDVVFEQPKGRNLLLCVASRHVAAALHGGEQSPGRD